MAPPPPPLIPLRVKFVGIKNHYREKSSALETKNSVNSQMYHSDGLKILNLDLKGLGGGGGGNLKAELDFSRFGNQ